MQRSSPLRLMWLMAKGEGGDGIVWKVNCRLPTIAILLYTLIVCSEKLIKVNLLSLSLSLLVSDFTQRRSLE